MELHQAAIQGPHQKIATANAKERFLAELFDSLWDVYRKRVSYVQTYERVIRDAGATFVNDHIAFRTFASEIPMSGIATLSRIFDALGYRAAGNYHFEDKFLTAIHLQHPNGLLPKLFISELKIWELSESTRETILRTIGSHRLPVSEQTLARLTKCDDLAPNQWSELRQRIVHEFQELPWNLPEKADVAAVNKESQYAAWVLVHGYNVNHFTSLINSHQVESLNNIEKTIAALQKAGVPMKAEIEGAVGTKLRQTATEAVVIDVDVNDGGQQAKMPWTYAYFELAERGEITDHETGRRGRFEGFLGPQATNLFEMTKKK